MKRPGGPRLHVPTAEPAGRRDGVLTLCSRALDDQPGLLGWGSKGDGKGGGEKGVGQKIAADGRGMTTAHRGGERATYSFGEREVAIRIRAVCAFALVLVLGMRQASRRYCSTLNMRSKKKESVELICRLSRGIEQI